MNDDLQTNFQAGVSSVYDAIVAKGVTPASTSLSDIINGIGNIATIPDQLSYWITSYSGNGSNCNLIGYVTRNGVKIRDITTNKYGVLIDDEYVKWYYASQISLDWHILKKGTSNCGYGTSGYVAQSNNNGLLSSWGYSSNISNKRMCTIFVGIELAL